MPSGVRADGLPKVRSVSVQSPRGDCWKGRVLNHACFFCREDFVQVCPGKGPLRRACSDRCKKRLHALWTRYRLEPVEFHRFWDEQVGLCAMPLCMVILDQFSCHVDHCHSTGRVRGLLCPRCNAMEGFYREAVRLGVVEYLEGGDAHA